MNTMEIIYTDRRPDHIIVGSTIAHGTERHIVRDIMHSVWEPRPTVTFLFENGQTLSMYVDITMHACQAHHHYYVEENERWQPSMSTRLAPSPPTAISNRRA